MKTRRISSPRSALAAAVVVAIISLLPAETLSQQRPFSNLSFMISNSSGTTFLAGFVGALLGEVLGKTILRHTAQKELAAEVELRHQQLTERDERALKSIATALEEYSVDHSGDYPKTLDALQNPYLSYGARIIPGSDPVVSYVYEHPASNPNFGAYDIKDNGAFDPTLDKLVNALDHTLCTRTSCKYIIYIANGGLFGI